MTCPTRRSGAYVPQNHPGNHDYATPGPQSDYAMPMAHIWSSDVTNENDHKMYWKFFRTDIPSGNLEYNYGPFMPALGVWNGGTYTWDLQGDMARWSDGSSNQFIVGEKHIPAEHLGVCEYSGSGNVWKAFDCSYLLAGDGMNCMSAYRPMVWHSTGTANPQNNGGAIWGLWRTNDELGDADHLWGKRTPAAAFGGWHPGVCQFVLGDGSVRALSVTVANPVLYAFTCVRDGLSVALP